MRVIALERGIFSIIFYDFSFFFQLDKQIQPLGHHDPSDCTSIPK